MNGTILYWVLFGILALGAGGGAGFGIASFHYAKMLESHKASTAISQGMLNDLERIAAKIQADVGEHSATVKKIDHKLAAAPGAAGKLEGLQQATGDLTAANERLQAGLTSAKDELNEQSQKLSKRQQVARTDELTLLMNRRSFDETLQTLVTSVSTSSKSGALLMLDIDHFQQFNDQHGREVGDKVLKHVARTLRDTLLGTDAIAARYGGEEFAVILPGATIGQEQRLAAAKQLANQIRAAVEAGVLSHGGESLGVRVSIGLVAALADATGEQLIGRADEALYAAKQAGRNRCFYHTGKNCLPIEGTLQPVVAAVARPPQQTEHTPQTELASSKIATDGTAVSKAPAAAATSPPTPPKAVSNRDRRKHDRIGCNGIHLVAPCTDGSIPSKEKFFRVQFCDISSGGFAMILPAPPTTEQFAVAIKKPTGLIFMGAQVMNVRQSDEIKVNGKAMTIVGCKFTQRLLLPSEILASPQSASA